MKNLVYLFLAFFFCGRLLAQESDTTVISTQPVETQQTSEPTAPSVVEQTVNTPTEPRVVEDNVQPRIIYYPNDNSNRNTQYRSNNYNRHSDIKTLSGNMNHSGGFWGISFRTTEFRDEATVLAGMRTGWIINRTLGIGVEGHGIIPTAKFDDVTDRGRVVLLGGYGGMFMEFIAFSNQVVHITFPISGGAGWLGYNRDWEEDFIAPDPNDPDFSSSQSDLIDDDVFWYVEPGVNLELNVAKHFRMAFGVSKRFTQDMELVVTDEDAFEKLNYYVTLKVGRF